MSMNIFWDWFNYKNNELWNCKSFYPYEKWFSVLDLAKFYSLIQCLCPSLCYVFTRKPIFYACKMCTCWMVLWWSCILEQSCLTPYPVHISDSAIFQYSHVHLSSQNHFWNLKNSTIHYGLYFFLGWFNYTSILDIQFKAWFCRF